MRASRCWICGWSSIFYSRPLKRGKTRARRLWDEAWPKREEDRRLLAQAILRAEETYPVILHILRRGEEAARCSQEGLALLKRHQFRLPDDLRVSWELKFRLNYFHSRVCAGGLTLPEAYREYQELLEAIEQALALLAEFPPRMAEEITTRMQAYAWQGWAKAALVRGRSSRTFHPLIEEGRGWLKRNLGLPLRISTYRLLARLGRRGEDPGWRSFAREATRLAQESGIMHHLYVICWELGPDRPRLLAEWGMETGQ